MYVYSLPLTRSSNVARFFIDDKNETHPLGGVCLMMWA